MTDLRRLNEAGRDSERADCAVAHSAIRPRTGCCAA